MPEQKPLSVEEFRRFVRQEESGIGGADTAHDRLVNACVVELRLWGCQVWRNDTGRQHARCPRCKQWVAGYYYGTPGVPDILGYEVPTGLLVAVEVKIGADALGKRQNAFQRTAEGTPALVFVVRDSLDDLREQWWEQHGSGADT